MVTLVSGCVEAERAGWISSSKTGAGGANPLWLASRQTDPAQERAPEIYRASGLALWDGTRTARGVWVSHPEAVISRRVRIVNTHTGAEVDGMLYRPGTAAPSDAVTISSDGATALGLEIDKPTLVSIFAIQSRSVADRTRTPPPAPSYGTSVEASAQSELANHIARMSDNQTLQLAAAAMRGMGYATVFEPGADDQALPEILAFPKPGEAGPLSAIRVTVRPPAGAPVTADDLAALQTRLDQTGDVGVMISLAGFADGAEAGLTPGRAHLERLDLTGLLGIWVTHYEALSDPDRALLRLQPVYFLAGGQP